MDDSWQLGPFEGQVANVCFAEGPVLTDGRWHLYHGMADSRIGCATDPGPRPTLR